MGRCLPLYAACSLGAHCCQHFFWGLGGGGRSGPAAPPAGRLCVCGSQAPAACPCVKTMQRAVTLAAAAATAVAARCICRIAAGAGGWAWLPRLAQGILAKPRNPCSICTCPLMRLIWCAVLLAAERRLHQLFYLMNSSLSKGLDHEGRDRMRLHFRQMKEVGAKVSQVRGPAGAVPSCLLLLAEWQAGRMASWQNIQIRGMPLRASCPGCNFLPWLWKGPRMRPVLRRKMALTFAPQLRCSAAGMHRL